MQIEQKLNILIVCEHASNQFGGEAVLPLNYFNLLSQTDHQVYLLAHYRSKPNLESIPNIRRDHIYYIPDTWLHRFLCRFSGTIFSAIAGILIHLLTQLYQLFLARRIVKKHHIDIIHEPAPVSPRQPSMMFGFGVPVIIGPMNGGMTFPPGFHQFTNKSHTFFSVFTRYITHVANVMIPGKLLATTLIVSNTRTYQALPKWRFGDVVELVENGVFTIKDKPIQHIQKKSVNIIFAGRLVDWKAVDIVIDAVCACKTALTLTIVGDGAERTALESHARSKQKINANSNIVFTGMVAFDEMNHHYDEADIFVLSSLYECGGAVVLEAMSRGLPVIATNWGGPADYITPETGFLVDPISREHMVQEFARMIDILATDPALRYRIGEAAITRVKTHFMWSTKIERMLAIYQQAILKKS